MKARLFLFSISLFSCINAEDTLPIVFTFPKKLKEISAVEVTAKSPLIWTIEDSGNEQTLYALDENGQLKQEINIKNAKNNDWEDLTSDETGNLYIGDFGNNSNERTNLAIYKIPASNLNQNATDYTEKIEFYYPEQTAFPPKKKELVFDCEAFFYYKNAFYLFTKNRSNNFDGTTQLYKVENKSGRNPAQLLGSFKTCNEFKKCAITSADISPDGLKVVLLSSSSAWIFTQFKADHFLSRSVQQIDLKSQTQKEGICFTSNSKLYITDERVKKTGGNLYELNLH